MGIHPTAIIDSKAEIDSSADIGPYCVIEKEVRVEAGCKLFQGVYLTGWTTIERGCTLHPGVIVGHAPQDTKYSGARTFCRIGQNTVVREYATIHRGTVPDSETRVGASCFLMAGSHVAHNCNVGNHVTMVNNVSLAGHVQVGDRVTIGGAANVHQFVRIGELAMIRGGSTVAMDVIPFALSDELGRIVGLNQVGLKRAEIRAEEVKELRMAIRTLYGLGLHFSKAVERLAGEVRLPAGRRLLEFLRQSTTRGIAGRRRHGGFT